jgi:hypothetical protein
MHSELLADKFDVWKYKKYQRYTRRALLVKELLPYERYVGFNFLIYCRLMRDYSIFSSRLSYARPRDSPSFILSLEG